MATIRENAVQFWFRRRHEGHVYPTGIGWHVVTPEKARRYARQAIADLRAERREARCTCGGIDAVPHATDHTRECGIWDA